jgi:hypothetical protein
VKAEAIKSLKMCLLSLWKNFSMSLDWELWCAYMYSSSQLWSNLFLDVLDTERLLCMNVAHLIINM